MERKRAPRLLAADLWIIYNFADPNERFHKFLRRGRPPLKRLIDSVFLHDAIVVPTQNFISLTLLVGVLGERTVRTLLEVGCLRFIRLKGALAYLGNGGGIKNYVIQSAEGKMRPISLPLDEAVAWALGGLVKKPEDAQLPQIVIEATDEVDCALSVNMSETVPPWKFSDEGEQGSEDDERTGTVAGDRGRGEGNAPAFHSRVQAEDRAGGRRL